MEQCIHKEDPQTRKTINGARCNDKDPHKQRRRSGVMCDVALAFLWFEPLKQSCSSKVHSKVFDDPLRHFIYFLSLGINSK